MPGPPPDVWADEGSRAASALEDVAAAILTGRDPEAVAAVALGIARAHAGRRRIAIADLVGSIPLLTPVADQPGLLECLRDGHPVSDIGQAVPGERDIYVLPSGRGPVSERWLLESARWERLIAGFREVDALLLFVVPPHAPGFDALLARVDGVVAVDLPPTELRAWPLLATIDHPEPELPPIRVHGAESTGAVDPRTARAPARARGRRIGRRIAGGALLLAAGLAAALWWLPRGNGTAGGPQGGILDSTVSSATAAPADVPVPAAATGPILEVTLGPIVNPSDETIATRFSVELVAANTLASANSTLRFPSGAPPVSTVVPVLLGAPARPWYRALVGAWRTREEAAAWLDQRRATGEVREGVGRVLELPYALLLADGVSLEDATAQVAAWQERGVASYALRQDRGTAHVFAGAFETVSQAVWLASMLRDATGETPRLAFRTGRMF